MTNDELKQAIKSLMDQGLSLEQIQRAARRVRPRRPRRVNGNWALKHEKHGECRSLSKAEIEELGYPVSEEISNA